MKKPTIRHFGNRVVRNVQTTDGRIYAPQRASDSEIDHRVARILEARMPTRDDRLDALSDGKVLASVLSGAGRLLPRSMRASTRCDHS